MLGILLHRDKVIPVIDLNTFFEIPPKQDNKRRIVIICEFNETLNGFVVDSTSSIHRLDWSDIQVVNYLNEMTHIDYINGVVVTNHGEVQMPDFEKIIASLFDVNWFDVDNIDMKSIDKEKLQAKKENLKIICCDDSSLIRKSLNRMFTEVNINNVTFFKDGLSAYQEVMRLRNLSMEEGKALKDYVNLIVTDIEMPKMDGLTFCKHLKDNVPEMPVIVLSSLISEQIVLKCKKVGADAWVAKSEMGNIITSILDLDIG